MLTMGLFLEVLFPKMDTGLQLGSHWQLVARHNCLSYFSYYSPINTARKTFLARASQSWLTFSIGSCISPDLPDLTYQVQDSWHWFLPLACPQQGRELCWAEAPACTTAPCASNGWLPSSGIHWPRLCPLPASPPRRSLLQLHPVNVRCQMAPALPGILCAINSCGCLKNLQPPCPFLFHVWFCDLLEVQKAERIQMETSLPWVIRVGNWREGV